MTHHLLRSLLALVVAGCGDRPVVAFERGSIDGPIDQPPALGELSRASAPSFEGSWPCGGRGEEPDAIAGCCPGLEDRGGTCLAACPVPIGGFGSQCFGCPNGPDGRWVCDDELGTVCDYPAGLSDDDCDGVDDDCNGSIDDAFRGGACTVPAGTIADCELDDLPGVQVCVGGAIGCDVADYCAIDASGGLQHGDDRCGTWASQCDIDPSVCIGATACNTTCECPVGTAGRCACCGVRDTCAARCWGIDEPPRC